MNNFNYFCIRLYNNNKTKHTQNTVFYSSSTYLQLERGSYIVKRTNGKIKDEKVNLKQMKFIYQMDGCYRKH